MDGLPVHDPAARSAAPRVPAAHAGARSRRSRRELGKTADADRGARSRELHEANPMLGHRGCRLAITYPEIYEIQVRAIGEAAVAGRARGHDGASRDHDPARHGARGARAAARARRRRRWTKALGGAKIPYTIGTMIELPRACVVADRIAEHADFFSFGTNDLTQTTFGLSRDDAGRFLPAYIEQRRAAERSVRGRSIPTGVGRADRARRAAAAGRPSPSSRSGSAASTAASRARVEFCHGPGSTTSRARRSGCRSPGWRRRGPRSREDKP